jgi:hypothetical protein
LLVGSSDSHYTASKFFPYWLSGKPIVGIFHKKSTIVPLSLELGGARLLLFDEENGPETKTAETAAVLSNLVAGDLAVVPPRNDAAFERYSARGIAARYAHLFDEVANS